MSSRKNEATADVGLIGLAVMGRNLSLNIADHGFNVAVYNRTTSVMRSFVEAHPASSFGDTGGGLVGCEALDEFVASLKSPRVIIVLVKAGAAVDAVCGQLLEAGVEAEDIVVDAGNSLWTDTIERERKYRGKLTFFGSGVSGGEVGARFGPSLMPGGDAQAWERLRPIWEAIAAKIDPDTGKPIETASPGKPVTTGEPCTAYIGSDGAGHYVKMVHNGIEYADMQLICEAYHLLRGVLDLSPNEIGAIFSSWNTGDLDSYLIEITADILQQTDPETGRPFVDVVLDAAGQKGTGRWTAINALNLGIPATAIAEAVFARALSARKEERVFAAEQLPQARWTSNDPASIDRNATINAVHDALYCSKICAYAQGFQLMHAAQQAYGWELSFGEIARIWRGGCIIRASFLQKIMDAYDRDPTLRNLLLDPYFKDAISNAQNGWRRVAGLAIEYGIPAPAFMASLAYYDGYRTATLPANLLQAQRDYFGAHTYERVDKPRGEHFHLDWPASKRVETAAEE